uniref:Protein kinase domain-containing protein n=1 Tax=Periophthalmus magnuspinnatus TaxID=409849 RepID=A0A3B3ZLH1_9GOBI
MCFTSTDTKPVWSLNLDDIRRSIPQNYEPIKSVSSGGFGQEVKCRKKDTEEFVAVKLPFYTQNTEKEVSPTHDTI